MTTDPVCGMTLKEAQAFGKSEYQGKTYYFCSSQCKAAFDKGPAKYAAKSDTGSHSHHH